jgi:hypothetical protein
VDHASVPRFMNLRSFGAKIADSIKSHTDVFNAKVLVTFMHECIFLDEWFVSDRNIGCTPRVKKNCLSFILYRPHSGKKKKLVLKSIDPALLSVSRPGSQWCVAGTYQSLRLQPLSTRSTAQHACTPSPNPASCYPYHPSVTDAGRGAPHAAAREEMHQRSLDPQLKLRPYPLRLGVLPIPAYCTPLSAPARPCIRAPPVLRALLCSPPLHCRAGAPRKRSAARATPPDPRARRYFQAPTWRPNPLRDSEASGAGDRPTKLRVSAPSVCPSVTVHRRPSPSYIRSPAVPFPPRCAKPPTNDHPLPRPRPLGPAGSRFSPYQLPVSRKITEPSERD